MNIREQSELIEKQTLSKYACLSENSKGRLQPEEKCPIRTDFQRDRDRIIHCKAFRRLKHKTQVFLSPVGDHYRTRLTHTLEVSQIARTIARALRVNEDLTEAISLGHDLGHTPFGHAGEKALNDIFPEGFRHFEQSLRVVDILENNGQGLNLTYETRNGILRHTRGIEAETVEGRIVKIADRIAYINHDIDDAVRAGVMDISDIPKDILEILGTRHSERINTLVLSLIENTSDGNLKMEENIQSAFDQLHKFMFDEVYLKGHAKSETQKIPEFINSLYKYFVRNPNEMPIEMQDIAQRYSVERAVCDYISGMTDKYAIEIFNSIFIPHSWNVKV
ncbi:MAG: deoxyguanosinetriphosphate triphosphohydrolase [Clostridia bacterium]|nr:deoxyguanosinetriphosphate triphosphohydrolase [Clostridia bacterium]